MTFDETLAKSLLRRLLDKAEGRVGEFVEFADLLPEVQGDEQTAASTLEELARRRWVHIRGDRVAATKWGLEFAMDWTTVESLLRAILELAKLSGPLAVGRPVPWDAAVAEAGLGNAEMFKLINELGTLDLAGLCRCELPDGAHFWAVYVSDLGWDYLNRVQT